jgi:CHAT domain-containing protein
MGLRRAFSVAGAQALLVTLWKVEDGETRRLMQAFYENWLEGGAPATALQAAQTAALQRLRLLPQQGLGGAIRGAGAFMAQTRGPVWPVATLSATKPPPATTSR